MSEQIQISDRGDGVAVLTLDRPERKNALSIALRDEISDALAELASQDGVKVVILTGAGSVFCAGFDLGEFGRIGEREFADRIWASSDRFHRALIEFPLPTIAAVNGPAMGGGCDLALMCDLRIASEAASFSHPEAAFGTVAYGLLHDLIGGSLARELTLTGRAVDAKEAETRGLAVRVVTADALQDEALDLARSIAKRPRDVLLSDKQKIIRRSRHLIRGTLDL
ncbi:MAG: enoyl-CoA hydratase/isomerase family protein [bacterium]|nr:enoyl-CoA hydratase/isomerase family protein [bacterium]